MKSRTHLKIIAAEEWTGRRHKEIDSILSSCAGISKEAAAARPTSWVASGFDVEGWVTGCRIEVRDVDDEGNCVLIGYIDARTISPRHDDEDDDGDSERELDPKHDHELDGDNEASNVVTESLSPRRPAMGARRRHATTIGDANIEYVSALSTKNH